jgi:sensor domain CHASE-containing protein
VAAAKKRDYFWVLAAIGVLAIVAVTVGLILFTRASDENAKNREEVVVRNGLRARIHEIEAQVVPQAVWDDAV